VRIVDDGNRRAYLRTNRVSMESEMSRSLQLFRLALPALIWLALSPADGPAQARPASYIRADSISRTSSTQAVAQRRREDYAKLGWSAGDIDTVMAHKIWIGMTAAMVREAWGLPERINRTITIDGTSDEWVYGRACVQIERGRVRAIQDKR